MSPSRRSTRDHSTDTLRTKRSHRSHSRDRDRREKRRDRDPDERRRRSRDRGSEREYRDRDRSRGGSHRDKDSDRDRERDRERRHRSDRRDGGERRHHDRDDRDRDRRRKREDGDESPELKDHEERSKRKRHEDIDDAHPPPPPSAGPPPPPPPKDSPRSRTSDRRDRSHERRYDDRRRARDPRDEFDDLPRYRKNGGSRDSRRPPIDDTPLDEDELDKGLSVPPMKRPSPTYEAPVVEDYNPDEPKEDDSEARSVFVSQLAARLTARDLGYFFEDKLGEGTVMDSRIVTDRLSRRSKGIGYVEFRTIDLVEKALSLSGTVVMGLPIMVQLTESERNRLHPGDGNLNLPPGVSAPHGGAMQLYVGSLHFNLTESDIKQVFEPFGELEFVDLHRDPMTGRSKGYAFVQYKRSDDAKMALEQMEGFELAGRTLRVNTVHEKGTTRYTQQDTLDEAGGGNLNAASRQALMQKLARIEPAPKFETVNKPSIPSAMQSKSVLLKNMFDPEEETERDWDKELAEDVKGECQEKYGKVEAIKVEKETQGEIYVKFDSIESAKMAIQGLNSRWFGGRQVSAAFISDAIMQAHQ
ncbi:hypothetical protein BJ138DRAFT_1108774 [Hygrophoropsis aurantiaca]|uniref:Uncharacterized protein n=1 Tax=Hygrophoropsis aurantiaca TaxID=72124 RepID=A0ACB8AT47_9AGAM|nr:hypothetical protein BJ138DRAFT_1108774 [Hygrophoropsis aurantiaca]